jgi:hypothetical protein
MLKFQHVVEEGGLVDQDGRVAEGEEDVEQFQGEGVALNQRIVTLEHR